MTTQQDQVRSERLNPHLRQRVSFIAALIYGPDNANWPAISDTFEDLFQESQGAPFEKSVDLLREPIREKNAQALVQTIAELLSTNDSSQQASAI